MTNGSRTSVTGRQADVVAGLLVSAVVLLGLVFTWNAYQQRQAVEGSNGGMMGGSGMMGSGMYTGPDPVWYLLGTLVVGAAIGGAYVLLRPTLLDAGGTSAQEPAPPDPGLEDSADQRGETDDSAPEPSDASGPTPEILDVLPEDERRVLEPVLSSPGLTQIALRDRSDFSKSKVSQTVSDLEKRGLLYREKQGRTYRVYPAEDLED